MKRVTIFCGGLGSHCAKFLRNGVPLIIFSMIFAGQSYAKINPDSVLGAWFLDEGKGTIAEDASGNGNDGTLMASPAWIAGVSGSALDFSGSSSYVDCGNAEAFNVDVFSVSFWCNIPNTQGWNHIISKGQHVASGTPGSVNWGVMMYDSAETILFETYNDTSWTGITADTTTGEWHHLVATYDGSTMQLYHDGQLASNVSGAGIRLDESRPFLIGARSDAGSAGGFFDGSVDEVGFFNTVLAAEDVETIMNDGLGVITVQPLARRPSPKDGAMYNSTWVTLSWAAGDFAVSHDIYLGDNFDEVNDATRDSETFRGNQPLKSVYFVAGFAPYPYPDGLVPGKTYYWRIDEVNDANAASPWKGNVWSFTVASIKAYEPVPADGSNFMDPQDVTLSWTAGLGAALHTVYTGDDFDTVANATGGPTTARTTYDPGALEPGKTYFWRVDELDEGGATHKGDVWSFRTLPDIPITDPNLVGWWKFDEGSGVNVLDSSGHANHGSFIGEPQRVVGPIGDALQFDGVDDWVEVPHDASLTVDNEVTVMAWINTQRYVGPTGDDWQGIMAKGSLRSYSLYTQVSGVLHFSTAGVGTLSTSTLPLNEWVHVCAMVVGGGHQYYINGEDAGAGGSGIVLPGAADTATVRIGNARDANRQFLGMIDDVRIYDKALTQDEVIKAMQGDPTLAWDPSPANRSTPDIYKAASVSWSPGEKAAEHDVYFGTDRGAVEDADASDTSGTYRGRRGSTSYTPPEGVEWGGGPYYWRIDEYNTDGTISKGNLWSFTVADFLLVDDFEEYNAGENQIWYAWHDGLGYGTLGSDPYFPGNGTGSAVGDENTASYTEETIVHSGLQSMPLFYDNNKQNYARYSEAELTLTALRDWTQQDVAELSLWFRGYPAVTGSFVEAPAGTYTMTGSGADIWYAADEFHYAFKMLTGAGSIVAKVLSVGNTDPWAKAGVMIRETLDADSKFAAVYITPGNGCRFQARINVATDATSDTSVVSTEQTAITAPYWVKLERDLSGSFKGYYSANGTTWTPMTWNPQYIAMSTNVYIGLAVTSHNAALSCQAVFSNVSTPVNVAGQWTHQDIGILSNDPEPLYAAVSNSAGNAAVVYHTDPAAAQIDTWTEWVIPLSAFSDQGIDLTDVDSIAIGLGTRGNTTIAGGSGEIFIDDIRLYRSREAVE
jgi:hypothetical protein